ncbi:hypothetical protein B2D45_14305 [Lactobacillus hilgardii]|uniref:Uncharacterized protein n=1 Tax=Lentilactobacillus hilgardii (strain ATCC 8290 / DSM 20176 / CCUG 30140 / JCM 1155 / KCTC 3500 / NBRC 15886 / NCIMB 8040 / NRRL B-1843 / 9) TaxID=1423757 RepID=C0XK98_LENH9|nr:hypothetical protein HMPREF0519_1659 [Lentilactobacillus hilgardii DSM 20176 = ATCC 8290]QEU37962.1 hypothetical protein LH500_02890 [Lentilactobacillus hilgardii]TDG86228.1 hypothetical protein C5L34_001237 [Lentilactobacillus hilgardii]
MNREKAFFWWIQFIINCVFMIYLASFLSNGFYSFSGFSFLFSMFLIFIAVILAYVLTMLVTNSKGLL